MIDLSDGGMMVKRDTCEAGNDYNGYMGARISSIFVIFIMSLFGSCFPILSSRYSFVRMPNWCFFIAKYFGSGVIVATAFIHLLEPAADSLGEPCLGGTFQDYPWAFAIALMTLFLLFFAELMSFHYVDRKISNEAEDHSHSHFGNADMFVKKDVDEEVESDAEQGTSNAPIEIEGQYPSHFSHAEVHQDKDVLDTPLNDLNKEQYYGQLVSIFVLEFGIIFHSVFIGLSLAVSGDEFKTLYIVLVFHQTFEGLGLGTRLATTVWPPKKTATPWIMAIGYAFTTPIAIAIGLGVRNSYPPGSRTALITNGVFDSISAGILFYAGIVELMAHEFIYSGEFKGKDSLKRMLCAYLVMCLGAGLMALLGKWA